MRQFLRHNQRELLEKEKKQLEEKLSNPMIENKGDIRTMLRRTQETLDNESPKPTTPQQRDELTKRSRELEEQFVPGMLTAQELRHNPSGVVGRLLDWERRNKTAIMEWKNIQIALNPESDDPDLASIERLRPKSNTFNLDDSQIPVKVYDLPSEQYKQNWAQTFGTPDQKAEAERQMQELEELKAEVNLLRAAVSQIDGAAAAKPRKKRRPLTEDEKRRLSEQGKARWAKKRAEEAAASAPAGEQTAAPA
jgi:hypothetical protein